MIPQHRNSFSLQAKSVFLTTYLLIILTVLMAVCGYASIKACIRNVVLALSF
jgi:hypothetical protein